MSAQRKILVVYYSRSGTTQRIAELLASELGADIEPVREPGAHATRAGARGYVRSLIDALCHRRVSVMPPVHDPSAYDAVVVGTPVWASCASAPAIAWLTGHRARIRRLALFCSFGGRGSHPALQQMAKAAGKSPLAVCAITAYDLHRRIDGDKRHRFAQKIIKRLARLQETEWVM
ncbi:flavodoxin [Paraburkholderia sp. LEh10]|uniref:flavodoxin family protein n=1 Tax=Paraburkholderia sp. LEh10 TaxID=2821353 RepID=UPI001AE14000|nr:flavodoxin [Paraburkholderia sp. LEh10]MBP0588624.1 flavodoxin [Paraburkholderia sp. LEh10]